MKGKYRKVVFFVVYSIENDKVQYLILRRKLHWRGWEFPKGGINFWETKKMAVKRELREEIRLNPIKIKKFGIKGKYDYKKILPDRKGIVGQKYYLFSVEVKKDKIVLGREHSSYKWLDYNEAYDKLTWQNQKDCLKIVDEWAKRKVSDN